MNRETLIDAMPREWTTYAIRQHLADALLPVIAAALDAAEERGRESVGLGDFLPDPCGDEHRARASHIAETYGEWLPCTLRRGHGGEHEHEDSGVNWPASPTGRSA